MQVDRCPRHGTSALGPLSAMTSRKPAVEPAPQGRSLDRLDRSRGAPRRTALPRRLPLCEVRRDDSLPCRLHQFRGVQEIPALIRTPCGRPSPSSVPLRRPVRPRPGPRSLRFQASRAWRPRLPNPETSSTGTAGSSSRRTASERRLQTPTYCGVWMWAEKHFAHLEQARTIFDARRNSSQ